MNLNDVAQEVLARTNAASDHIKNYLDTTNEDRLKQDDVYVHIREVEKPYHILIGHPLSPMKENKGDVIRFALRGAATTDPKICAALVSVMGFELQRLGEHKNCVLHVVSQRGTGFTFDYSTTITAKHFIEGAADVKIAPVIFKEDFLNKRSTHDE